MTKLMTGLCCAGLLGMSALVSAQSGTMDKGKMGKEMKMMGCVAESADNMGHFMLNNAMMSSEMKGDMKGGMKDTMKPMSYMLMGGDLKAHVGHKVEVTGMMADSMMGKDSMGKDSMGKDKMSKDTMSKDGMAKPDMQTLNVKSVKMMAPTCN